MNRSLSMRAFSEYTFLGLCNHGQPIGTPDLAYLIGLVDSPNHKIVEPFSAKKILTWLFDEEEQVSGAIELLSRQEKFFSRYFRGGFYPQTPVMLTQAWSPIGAMLEHGIKPVALKRENQLRSVATGIWEPTALAGTNS